MTDVTLMKSTNGALIPCDAGAQEFIAKLKAGAGVRAKISKVRNINFHRKFFALLNIGFEAWETPDLEYAGMKVEKEFERFRKDVTILAGFYTPVYNMKGEVRLEAKSIAFGNMSEDEFERVYSAVANVLLTRILKNYTREDLDSVVEQIMGFV
jgi:hypothetical protein